MRKDKKIKQQKHKSKMQYRKKYDFFVFYFCYNQIK